MRLPKNLYSQLSIAVCVTLLMGWAFVYAFTPLVLSDADAWKPLTSSLMQMVMTNINDLNTNITSIMTNITELDTNLASVMGKFWTLASGKVCTSDGVKINCTKDAPKTVVQVDTANYTAGTTWKIGPLFPTVSGFKAGSRIKLSYHMPMRNDSTSWGGAYIEPQISFDGGSTWKSLGSSWYDGAIMNNGGGAIGSYFNTLIIDPVQSSDFSVTVRFYFRSYDGDAYINQSHNINTVSGTAPILPGTEGTQHYTKILLEEIY